MLDTFCSLFLLSLRALLGVLLCTLALDEGVAMKGCWIEAASYRHQLERSEEERDCVYRIVLGEYELSKFESLWLRSVEVI